MDENYGPTQLATLDWLVCSHDDRNDHFVIANGADAKGS